MGKGITQDLKGKEYTIAQTIGIWEKYLTEEYPETLSAQDL